MFFMRAPCYIKDAKLNYKLQAEHDLRLSVADFAETFAETKTMEINHIHIIRAGRREGLVPFSHAFWPFLPFNSRS
jgi:hypothetical protein